MMLNIDISYDIDEVQEFMKEEKIQNFIEYILNTDEKIDTNEELYLSILITTNEIIQTINRDYRGKDTTTDVISFAYNETENIGPFNILGDIVISFDKVKEQAIEYNHNFEREFYYVLGHGMLHLIGFDHVLEEDKKIMRKREEEILSKFEYIR